MSDRELEFHAYANIFPLMEGIAFRDLVEDIRIHGLREPILLHEGAILDGRNRYRACHAAQVACRFKTYDGKDALAFVVSANLHRRHLDTSQRAMIAAAIANLKQKVGGPKKAGRRGAGDRLLPPAKKPRVFVAQTDADEIGANRAGEMLNVSGASVLMAKRVLNDGVPELVEAVRSGQTSVFPASELARLPQAQQRAVLAAGGVEAVTAIGRESRAARLDHRRVERAGAVATDKAVFDHFKIGDGRSIDNVRLGELRRLAERADLESRVLFAILNRFANLNHGDRVRDVLTASVLAEIIQAATRQSDGASQA